MDIQTDSVRKNADKLFSVTELADEFDITPRAIRFYESKGLLSPQRAGSTRVYTYRDRARLIIILRGKRMGFSLGRIKEYLDLYEADPSQIEQVRHFLEGVRIRLSQLEEQRADIENMFAELKEAEKQALEALGNAGIKEY